MKYGYTVKYNGVYYSAGEEVPENDVKAKAEVENTSAFLDEEKIPKKRPGRPKKEQ